jgi:hypothetical protein
VPVHQFLFALKISDQPRLDSLLDEVAECVLGHVGYAPPAIADILGKLHGTLEQVRVEGRPGCDVQFRAEAGQLLIIVLDAEGRQQRVTRPLPD